MMAAKGFDARDELNRVHRRKRLARQRPYSRHQSQLDRYGPELLALWNEPGCRVVDLQAWLHAPPRKLKVHHSTVTRWLRRTLAERDADQAKGDTYNPQYNPQGEGDS